MRNLLASLQEKPDGHSCIPTALADPLLEMKTAHAIVGDIPTIFLGMVDEKYTVEEWNDHKDQIVQLFSITDHKCIGEIKVQTHKTGSLNAQLFGQEMSRIITEVNNQKPTALRIVSLGPRWSPVLSDALLTFIRAWQIPPNQKTLQLITLGESADSYFLSFCKDICLKRTCAILQFYNAHDYDVFGTIK